MPSVLSHNLSAGSAWGSGGAAYDVLSEHTADAIAHVVDRIWPTPGERFLDIATGTGWTARHLAARGAVVTGIDIGDGVIEAAKRLGPGITFQVGDAEALEFAEGAFDGVTSTFGVMFVARPAAAAGEIARVIRKGGRLALVTWLPGGPVEDLFKLTRTFMPAPPAEPLPSPFEWSREERARELLGGAFELTFERGTNVLRMPSGQIMWDIFVTGFGPMKALAASLDSSRRTALEREFVSLHERYRTTAGLAVARDYIVTIGVRR